MQDTQEIIGQLWRSPAEQPPWAATVLEMDVPARFTAFGLFAEHHLVAFECTGISEEKYLQIFNPGFASVQRGIGKACRTNVAWLSDLVVGLRTAIREGRFAAARQAVLDVWG